MAILLTLLHVISDAMSTAGLVMEQEVMSVYLVMRDIIYLGPHAYLTMLDGRNGSTMKAQVEGVGQIMDRIMAVDHFLQSSVITILQLVNGLG